jgi:serine/threonine protein kinase
MNPLEPTFGPYVLQKRLGVGGMAEAFEALRRGPAGFEQRVCLKRVLPALNADQTFREQFTLEARIAAMLRHNNIVGVIDFGEHEGTYYLAMELVEGVDLRTLLQRMNGRLPTELVVLVVHDLARALAYAHEPRDGRPGIVHRDISPSNLLLNNDGDLKLADFGIAKAMHTAGATASNVVKGKIQYMAPEQMLGTPVDGRADLFALGVLLYEVLCGRRPFDGQTDVDTMRRVIDGVRIPLRELAPDAPNELMQLAEDLLATNPEQRPAHAGLVLDRLPVVTATARRRMAAEVQRARNPGSASEATLPAAKVELPSPPQRPSGATPVATFAEPTRTRPGRPRSARPWMMLGASVLVGVGVGLFALLRTQSPSEADSSAATRSDKAQTARSVGESPQVPASKPAAPEAQTPLAPKPSEQPLKPSEVPPTVEPIESESKATAIAHEEEPRRSTREERRERAQEARSSKRHEKPDASDDVGKERATIHVVLIPWGEVWVDGRYMGRAPTDVVVSPGEHKLEVGKGSAERSQRITVKPGERRNVELELE